MQKSRLHLSQIVIVSIVIITVIAAIITVFLLSDSHNDSSIEILVAPESARIQVGNKTYKNGQHKLPSGSYHVVISKDGFITQELDIELIQGKTTRLLACLNEENGSYDWYNSNADDRQLCTSIGDQEAEEIQNQLLEEYPISTIIPIRVIEYDGVTYTNFRIDINQSENCHTEFCLQITDFTGGNEQRAYDVILEKGYNPSDYEIIYTFDPKPMPVD